jgi:hypothetical protein
MKIKINILSVAKLIAPAVRIHTSAKHLANARMGEFVTKSVADVHASLAGWVKFVEIDALPVDSV